MQTHILKKHAGTFNFFARLLDLSIIILAAYAAFVFRFSWSASINTNYRIAIALGCLAGIIAFTVFGLYSPMRGKSLRRRLALLLGAWVTTAVVLTLFAFLTKTGARFSREWLGEWMAVGFGLSLVLRTSVDLLLRFLRQRGFNTRRIVILGAGDLGRRVAKNLLKAKWTGYQILCFMDDDVTLHGREPYGVLVQPVPENFEQLIHAQQIDEVWIALPLRSLERIEQVIHQLRFSTVNVKVVPDIFSLDLLNHSVVEVAGLPVLSLRATPMEGFNRFVKSCEDKFLSGLILLLISPLLAGIAIAVKMSSKGPVFYRQERISWNNKPFMMLKFRSMPVNAEAKTGATWAKPGENRATKVGAFLRKTSLDELPQFINVLKGDMSIVGPRPERPVFVEQFKSEIPGYMQKHMVKAGITGWAQVNGWRGSTDLHKRIQYDLYYIEHWSLWFDLRIIMLTFLKGFINKNAY